MRVKACFFTPSLSYNAMACISIMSCLQLKGIDTLYYRNIYVPDVAALHGSTDCEQGCEEDHIRLVNFMLP